MALELSFGCEINQHAGVTLLQWASWLREGVLHGISTREGGVSRGVYSSLNLGDTVGDEPGAVKANRAKLGAALGDMRRPMVFVRQVHGAHVHVVDVLPQASDPLPEADALITNRDDVFLALTFGDCVPVLFYDPEHHAVGVAHGGWRGLEAGVLRSTVEAMKERYGTSPSTLQAALGPHIGDCCYEVGEDVASRFEDITRAVRRDPAGRTYLNLSRIAREQLTAAGLSADYVNTSAACTMCFVSIYYSHRCEGVTGRFAAVIGMGGSHEG